MNNETCGTLFHTYCSLTSLFTSNKTAHLQVHYTVGRGTRNAELIFAQLTVDDTPVAAIDIQLALSLMRKIF